MVINYQDITLRDMKESDIADHIRWRTVETAWKDWDGPWAPLSFDDPEGFRQKKLEQKIMNAVPFLIIFYVSSTSRGFFDVLYHNPAGIVVMTVCLGFYGAAYRLSRRIVEINI